MTTVEIKSGYGLDTASEIRLLNAARAIGRDEPVRIVTDPARRPRAAARAKEADARRLCEDDRRGDDPRRRQAPGSPPASTPSAKPSPSPRPRSSASSPPPAPTASPVRLHAEQLSNQNGAALAASYKALSADHLEHLDAAGARAMAAAGTVAVLLPGAFYALKETRSRRSSCCATPASRSPSPPTATPAPRPCSTRSWR